MPVLTKFEINMREMLINDKRVGKPPYPRAQSPLTILSLLSGLCCSWGFSPALPPLFEREIVNKAEVAFVALKETSCSVQTHNRQLQRETILSTPPAGMRKLDNRLLSGCSSSQKATKPLLQGKSFYSLKFLKIAW